MTWLRRAVTPVVAGGALLAAFAVILAPTLPVFGERHTPHLHKPPLLLGYGHTLEQTARFEYGRLDRVVVWVEPPSTGKTGSLELTVDTQSRRDTQRVPLSDIPPSGTVIFPVNSLHVQKGTEGRLRLSLTSPGTTLPVKYQIASGIYADGALFLDGRAHQGDLAFQLRYQRPALGSNLRQWAYAVVIAGAGLCLALALRGAPQHLALFSRRTAIEAGLAGIGVAIFYGLFLLPFGIWVGASDFSKDAAYLVSGADAIRGGAWPTWSHLTCGGMALLGNPEGNTLSLGSLLATVFPADRALVLLLVIEAGIGAAGVYVLAQANGLRLPGRLLATAITTLGGSYAYRIVEGLTPVGGAVAFAPWVFFFLQRALQQKIHARFANPYAVLAGAAFALIFFRGDVHIIVGLLLTAGLWTVLAAVQRRSFRPLAVLLVIGATFFLGASVKVLPYLEQPALIQETLPPYVLPLTRSHLLDDVFLRIHDRGEQVLRPLHGRRPEQWGNFGGYVGAFSILLVGVGAITKHRARSLLLASALLFFLLSEGQLFESFLRHQPLLGSLLRVPTRLLSGLTLFQGLLAGIGADRVARDGRGRTGVAVTTVILLLAVGDLSFATGRILLANTEWRATPPARSSEPPTLVPQEHRSPQHERHASILLRAGFLLPKICGDQNNPPDFIKEMREPLPLADVPAATAPNRVVVQAPSGPRDITLRERFTSSWHSSTGEVLSRDDGSTHLLTPAGPPATIELRYDSATIRAQQTLFLLSLLGFGTLLASGRRASGSDPSS